MSKVKVEVEVSKEAHELALGLSAFVISVSAALKDGWQPGTDLPVVLAAAVTDLVPAVQGVEALGAEEKEDVKAFALALALPGLDLGFKLAGK